MESLFEYQEEVLESVRDSYFRPLFYHLDWDQRMFGITGLRGTGKTTMLLQYLKFNVPDHSQALYVTADHTWFYDHSLYDLARRFTKYGGTLLLIDEIHKYPRWSRELKNIYDGLPELKVIFTASSALDILKGEADLSRRVLTFELTGLSFREYLEFDHQQKLTSVSLGDLLTHPDENAQDVLNNLRHPLPLFREYLQRGYFPFSKTEEPYSFRQKLNQVINTIMEVDLQIIEDYSAANTIKMKRLLGVIAESAPFEPNISKIASRLEMGRDTVKTYLYNLENARLLNLLSRSTKGVASLQKPDKIYVENTNFTFALKQNPNPGTLRETFFVNQLRNAGHTVELAPEGDFLVDKKWTFEVGGPSKDEAQIRQAENAYLALDELEHAYLNRIPLWLFGFLY
ncbi:MAG: AAA family ATPase [Bacteroidetes bacterium]|jgi:predicted AAA+ superfamily ATPase|nr:AAA family ATPase [Bacteroidota bacterium]